MKEIILIGGPNGAGKTTTAKILLPEYFETNAFLNADEIARELSLEDGDLVAFAASRVLIERMRALIGNARSFALETTCSGRSFLPYLENCRASGYTITLYHFWLSSPELSLQRVAKRVRQGGHNIPTEVILRRFRKGLWNMRHLYLPLADTAAIYDNSGTGRVLIATKENSFRLRIHDAERWARIEELT